MDDPVPVQDGEEGFALRGSHEGIIRRKVSRERPVTVACHHLIAAVRYNSDRKEGLK
jgi:hypothetical protein